MNLKIKHRFYTPRSYYGLRKQFQDLLDTDMIIFHRQSRDIYCNPVRVKLKQVNNNFIVCKKQNGYKECFSYQDLFCGNVIQHTIGR